MARDMDQKQSSIEQLKTLQAYVAPGVVKQALENVRLNAEIMAAKNNFSL